MLGSLYYTQSHPSRSLQSAMLGSLYYITTSHWPSVFHMTVHLCQCHFLSLPPFSFPCCVRKCVLYVCISIPSLQMGSSVQFFKIPYICIHMWYLFFSFWLSSLSTPGSGFIYLTTADSNPSLFMAEWYPIAYEHHIFIHSCFWWTSRLLSCPGYCK